MKNIEGRTAVVSGGSRGIGAACALELGRNGANVAILYRSDETGAEAVCATLARFGVKSIRARADVTDEPDVRRAFAEIEAELGPADILINNAGVHRGGKIDIVAPRDFALVVDTSLFGTFLCTREVVPNMRHEGWGRIVNVGSVVGKIGFPGDVAYASAKSALVGFTRALAVELAGNGITVNLVSPGFVDTDMTGALSDAARDRLRAAIPLGRTAKASEIASLVVDVVESDYVTGATFTIDGGLSTA